MINKVKINIKGIPAIIWGEESDKVYIYVHGKMGCKENAETFAELAILKGYQVISFDLPEHGERKTEDYPIMVWNGVSDLKSIHQFAMEKWKSIYLYACSLGAYFSLLAYKDIEIKKSLFQCPVLNMEKLISNMMKWENVSEEKLKEEKIIETNFGETLYWDYCIYVKEHPVDKWNVETYILYPSKDMLTEVETVDKFANEQGAYVTTIQGAEHYFTDEKYINEMKAWIKTNI